MPATEHVQTEELKKVQWEKEQLLEQAIKLRDLVDRYKEVNERLEKEK